MHIKTPKLAIAAILALSQSLAFAQQSGAVTRATVRNDLVQLEHAGYNPFNSSPYYPQDLLAAQAKLNASIAMGDRESLPNNGIGATDTTDPKAPTQRYVNRQVTPSNE